MISPFVVYSQPRCGSTTLIKLLGCHPAVRVALEPFSPDTSLMADRLPIRRPRDLVALLDDLLGTHEGIKHVWHHRGWPFPNRARLNLSLLRYGWGLVVFLNRKNILQQAVSNQVALQTRVFHAEHKARTPPDEIVYPALDRGRVERFLRRSPRLRARARRLLVRRGIPFVDLWYEDLYQPDDDPASRRSTLAELYRALELSLDDEGVDHEAIDRLLDPARTKVNSEATYRAVPNIDEIEARFGSDETGWLFS